METQPPPPAPCARRVPPPCWTRDETVALIQAYRDRWFALGRGNLRAADWDAVADAVSSYAESGTSKTAVQCRHKIEKMRKRFRSEKQRGLKRPGNFFSSWDLYPLLDSMNFAYVGSGDHHGPGDSDDVRFTAVDGLSLKLANDEKFGTDSGLKLGFQDEFRAGYCSEQGFENGDLDFKLKLAKFSGDRNFVTQLVDYEITNSKIRDSYNCGLEFDRSVDHPGVSSVAGFHVKSLADTNLFPSGFKARSSFRSSEKYKTEFSSFVLPGARTKDYNKKLNEVSRTDIDISFDAAQYGLRSQNFSGADDVCFVGNGYTSASGFCASKKSGGSKRSWDVVEEMVLSINFLSQVFSRMEKAKMEMVREIEKMRMEMEMKQSQMILDSQQQMVDSFTKALLETKKSGKKMKLLSPRANGDEDERGDAFKH